MIKKCVMLGLLLSGSPAWAEEPTDDQLKAEVAAMAKEAAADCEFTLPSGASRGLKLHPQPLLRWSNPTAGKVFGEVHLWTDRGRPMVVASMYRFFAPDWGDTLEVASLTSDELRGRRGNAEFWRPARAGMSLEPFPGADPPASTPGGRLVQMRRLATGFVAQLHDTRNNTEGTKRQLRLLNQPVYRYPAPTADAGYLDGALFAFVEGTDPEVLLLIEAPAVVNRSSWKYGLSRMNADEVHVSLDDREVWSAPRIETLEQMYSPKEPYSLSKLREPIPAPAGGIKLDR